ncbi:MAG: hypothetical protein EP330_08960 [Deltaproteobacteria bacterium]|nr:MAG: hypothetical protein EP330_08960 [Deltaproteobacteria bacterium]
MTQEFDDPQAGLDERLDWARSRLADPRYSRSARFLVSHENELRTILREGEQAWLHRQITGTPVSRRPAPSIPPVAPPLDVDDFDAPPPPVAAPALLTPPDGNVQPAPEPSPMDSLDDVDLLNPLGESTPVTEVNPGEIVFSPPMLDPADSLLPPPDDFDVDGLPPSLDEGTMFSPEFDADNEPTKVARRSMLPIDAVLDPPSEFDADAQTLRMDNPLGPSILNDPATEAVEGDWDRLGANMPSLHDRPFMTDGPRGGLFEDVLDDHDTHASFDTSTAPPSHSTPKPVPQRAAPMAPPKPSAPPFSPKPEPPPPVPPPIAPASPAAQQVRSNITMFASDLPPEPVESTATPHSHAPLGPPIPVDEPDEFTRETTASTRFVKAKKKTPRYDPYLLAASAFFGLAMAYLFVTVQPLISRWMYTRDVDSGGSGAAAQVLVRPTAPVEPAEIVPPTPTEIEPGEPVEVPEPVEGVEPAPPEPAPPEPVEAVQPAPPQPVQPAPVEPVAVKPAPQPVKPTPVPPKPQPVATAPVPQPAQPVPVKPAPVKPAPEPVVAGPDGSWAGTNGSGEFALRLAAPKRGKIEGVATMTVSGAKRTFDMSGTWDEASKRLALIEVGGSVTLSGTLDDSTGRGTWSPGAGATERQWFVVRK